MNKKRLSTIFRTAGMAGALILILAIPAIAEGNEVTTVLTNLVTMVFDILRLVGVLACIWGIVQFAMSFSSHDPSQRISSVLFLAGGLIFAFLKNILTAIGVSI